MNKKVILKPLEEKNKEQFILDNQRSFKYGAVEEFGLRDEHYEEDDEIISRKTIVECLENPLAKTFSIYYEDKIVGGVIVYIEEDIGDLEILYINPEYHSLGIGQQAWWEIEKMFPNIKKWKTCTPYFEKRNIHFYVNKLKFHIVEFSNEYQHNPLMNEEDFDMFFFEKIIK